MQQNSNLAEIGKFDQQADHWWKDTGPFSMLHRLNPVRVGFIQNHCTLKDIQFLDIGCGGGILTESLAREEAIVTGIDPSPRAIETARNHANETGLSINYQCAHLSQLLENETPHRFDAVSCMEVLEHVDYPGEIIRQMSQILNPGGFLFLSTINRSFRAWAKIIFAAEVLLRMIPSGTHSYNGFIRPSELVRFARSSGFDLISMKGIAFNPLRRDFSLGNDLSSNYIACFRKNR